MMFQILGPIRRRSKELGNRELNSPSSLMQNREHHHMEQIKGMNKARPLCDLIKLNTILAQEYVARKASTGTHVTSDLLNTGRFYMALYPPTRVLTSRLRGYLSTTTSRGHLGTTYTVSPEDKHRDITRTKEDKKRTHHIQPVL
jgi:hypothetical protein